MDECVVVSVIVVDAVGKSPIGQRGQHGVALLAERHHAAFLVSAQLVQKPHHGPDVLAGTAPRQHDAQRVQDGHFGSRPGFFGQVFVAGALDHGGYACAQIHLRFLSSREGAPKACPVRPRRETSPLLCARPFRGARRARCARSLRGGRRRRRAGRAWSSRCARHARDGRGARKRGAALVAHLVREVVDGAAFGTRLLHADGSRSETHMVPFLGRGGRSGAFAPRCLLRPRRLSSKNPPPRDLPPSPIAHAGIGSSRAAAGGRPTPGPPPSWPPRARRDRPRSAPSSWSSGDSRRRTPRRRWRTPRQV